MTRSGEPLTSEILCKIIERYDTDELIISTAYEDAGTERLRGRLEGGLLNQMDGGDAMSARYAIWANTVRDNIIAGMEAFASGNSKDARRFLIRAANSLSAFADAQAFLDPLNLGARPNFNQATDRSEPRSGE